MALASVLLLTASVVVAALLATCVLCLERDRLPRDLSELRRRVTAIAPYLGAVALFFVLKQATSGLSHRISHALGWDITDALYAAEGLFVAHLQDLAPEASYVVFSVLYFFGFPYLLIVPPILYFLSSSLRRLKELLVAYVLNYFVGAICYTLFLAYGPRIRISSSVDGVMYSLYPQTQELTAAMSDRANVFPSLHTSLAVVVLLFALATRRRHPRWCYFSTVVAVGVVLSTMVLGIHWLSDVVAGVLLGGWSVLAARRIVATAEGDRDVGPATEEGSGTPNVGD